MKKLVLIDYLKGFSIFTIIIMHLIQGYLSLPNIVNQASGFGGAGVHIFIICSGFGLFYSYLNKNLSYKEFLKKRFIKIYMPYILIILISALIPYIYIYSDRIMAVLSHIFLFKMFIEKYECSFGVQFWFLSTIIQFYLIFILLTKVKKKLNDDKKFMILSWGISLIWWIIVFYLGKSNLRVWNSFFLQYLWEFSLGMVLATKYYNSGKINIPKKRLLVLGSVIGIILTGITGIYGGYLKLFNDIPSVMGYGGIALLIFMVGSKYINTFFINLSSISYELYLIHILVYKVTFKSFESMFNKYFIGILAIVFSIVLAYAYNKCRIFILKR
ncbi:acyltransferase [Clostridium saudiense]|uniref:Acyltransferase n=1 Tax=Clostridium saudiense TaxID=1414720 RepID=A0ABS2FJV5_9CLOT|nr:acyltransferase [Clostridium saudiense]MBM6820173.1 acyltransferase [Clostridium saudiense]